MSSRSLLPTEWRLRTCKSVGVAVGVGASCDKLRCILQAKFAALSTSAKQWSDQTGATLRSAAVGHFGGGTDSPTASSTLKEIARSRSEALPESAAGAPGRQQQADGKQKDAGLGRDQELEAYLHVSLYLPLPSCDSRDVWSGMAIN